MSHKVKFGFIGMIFQTLIKLLQQDSSDLLSSVFVLVYKKITKKVIDELTSLISVSIHIFMKNLMLWMHRASLPKVCFYIGDHLMLEVIKLISPKACIKNRIIFLIF